MNRRLFPVLMTALLDGAGIGLTMPILPALLRDVGHRPDLGWRFGAFLGLYALMQFLFSPILGSLSDRLGRRPVLLLSLAGASIDYLFMAFAPNLTLLFLGRAIAGTTSASMAVATAYVADVTAEDQRARAFGQLSGCVGLGFVAGPAIGGVLGAEWVRAPFMVAAGLNAINLLWVLLALPESRARSANARIDTNPLAPLRWVLGFPALVPLIAAFVVIGIVGQIGGTIWVLYGEDRFHWPPVTIGLSLAAFGLFHAVSQAGIAGPVVERWGERRAMLIGIVVDSVGYVLIALATKGWMGFALMPLFCVGGIAAPALQSLLSGHVSEGEQGRLQGALASLTSLVTIVAPLLISTGYFASRSTMPGAVWIAGAVLYLLCLPAVLGRHGVARRSVPA